METKFTPGPWSACKYSSLLGAPITAQPDPTKNQFVVAVTQSAEAKDAEGFRVECEANAALIAMAPELLEALIGCRNKLSQILYEGKDHPLVSAADDAIAKATGA